MNYQSNLSDFGLGEGSETDLYECEICGSEFVSAKRRGLQRSKTHSEQEVKKVYVEELQLLADQLGRSPGLRDMHQHGNHSSKSYQNAFGSWNEEQCSCSIITFVYDVEYPDRAANVGEFPVVGFIRTCKRVGIRLATAVNARIACHRQWCEDTGSV